jgi:tetratricopeptide (TPR) repeat protein
MQYIHSTRFVLLTLSLLSACAASGPAPRAAAADPKAAATEVPVTGATGEILTARFAESQNDLNYAADRFLQALANDPHSPDLLQQAFLTCLLAGRPEALRLARLQPDVQAAQLLVADSEAGNGNWDKAESLYATLPKQGLTQVLQPLLVAWAQQGGGKTDAALATLNPYVEGSKFKGIYALHAALIADMAKRAAEAARLYRLAQADFGATNLELAREVASWQNRQGFPADASKTLEALADADPEFAIAMAGLKADAAHPQMHRATDGIAEAYLALAAALSSQDNSDFSLVLIQLSLRLRPDLTAARLLAADILDARQHPSASLRILAPVATDDPLDPVVRVRRVTLLDRTGQSEEALRMLGQLAKDFPNSPEPPTMEGDILREKSRFADAAAAYDRAIALVPHPTRIDWPLFYDRGIALERSHNWTRAEADFQKALELSPDQPFVLNYLGYSWAEQGRNLAKARQMIQRALEERPNDGAIVDSLGWVMLKQGDVAGAITNLEHAVELEPEDATINGHLGDAYATAGRKLEAQYQWRLALSFKPEPDEVPKLQAKLREGEQANGANPATAPAAAALPSKATP